jgi:NAD(P)H-dependent FMN reductase
MALTAPYAHQIETIDGEQFLLNPKGDFIIQQLFDRDHHYGKTLRFAQNLFTRSSQCINSELNQHAVIPVRKLIPADVCRKLIQHYQDTGAGYLRTREGAFNLFEALFNEQVDAEIISHFGSEYMPLWYNISADNHHDSTASCSFKWHCDGGPSKHIKIMIYLNDSEEHGANTLFSTPSITDALKKIGYIFCGINQRKADIRALVAAHNIQFTEKSFSLQAGDALMFNPYAVMHKGKAPKPGKVRYVLHICLVPSPVGWRESMQNIRWPTFGCIDFVDFSSQIKNAYDFFDAPPPNQDELLLIDQGYQIHSLSYCMHILKTFFKPSPLSEEVIKNFIETVPEVEKIHDLTQLVNVFKTFLQQSINAQRPGLKPEMLSLLQELLHYEQEFFRVGQVYNKTNKPNPDAVFWPDATREGAPDLFNMMPFVKRYPFITKSTPIGSAGSCFAFELSKKFQLENFNYVITERADDVSKGVIVDDYKSGDPAKFCANYGIQFNTPSFRQLAEKAFQKRQFSKILSQEGPNLFMDPYRENVFFTSKQAYLDDYPQHVRAIREALMTCEAFIITLGLNECWEFIHDGSVMSRNPKHSMSHLVRPKVLTLQENIDNIQTFLDIVRSYNPGFKLIISLSPIPFLATHQADHQHVVEANCHSKAVLRLAAEEIVKNNNNVFYLPSYELVTHCSKDAWNEDNRHVKDEVVRRVIQMFKEMFVVPSDR